MHEIAPHIEVWVEGRRWREVRSLANAGTDDEVFVVDRDRGSVEFGDGVHGRSLPLGAEAVVAAYRSGGGASGNAAPIELSSADKSDAPDVALWTPIRAATASIPLPNDRRSDPPRHDRKRRWWIRWCQHNVGPRI